MDTRIADAVVEIERRCRDPSCLRTVAEITGLTYGRFSRLFKRYVGLSPVKYVLLLRFRDASSLLMTSTPPIKRVALVTGFRDLSHFARSFKDRFGLPPGVFRRRANTQP